MAEPLGCTRPDALAQTHWDVLVVGGGIIGAGIFREAARHGLRVLLIDKPRRERPRLYWFQTYSCSFR